MDFSGTSGAAALLAMVAIDGPKPDATVLVTPVELAGQNVTIVTMQAGKAPEVKVDGDTITVGRQPIRCDGKKLAFGT